MQQGRLRSLVLMVGVTLAGLSGRVSGGATGLEMVFVSGQHIQAGGPTHHFLVARHEVTNGQYVVFLNDALSNLSNGRGAYLFFETTTGDVYINGSAVGAVGPTHGSLTTLLFSPASGGQIEFVDGAYRVIDESGDFSGHPVTGVTWYGAVKFCNWLTLATGFAPGERVYFEGASPGAWRPVTISSADWSFRDLTTGEREALLNLRGFRLPMDNGQGVTPGPYGEWVKIATARDAGAGAPVFDAAYGFGRQVLTGADANYRCSGDPWEDECIIGTSTPVGFYDGVNELADGTPTNGTSNGYGLYDLTGNVWEWMQDQSFLPADRRVRGGSYRSSPQSLVNTVTAELFAGSPDDATGFRVAQSVVTEMLVLPALPFETSGIWGGAFDAPGDAVSYVVRNLTDAPMTYQAETDEDWVTLEGFVAGVIGPGEAVTVSARITAGCDVGPDAGSQSATLYLLDVTHAAFTTRQIDVTLSEPLSVTPTAGIDLTREFSEDRIPTVYTISHAGDLDVEWTARAVDTQDPQTEVDWIRLDGMAGPLSSTLPGGSVTQFEAEVDLALLTVGTHTATIEIVNECTSTTITRPVEVTVFPPLDVTSSETPYFFGGRGGPFVPSAIDLSVVNLVDRDIEWELVVESLEPPGGEVWLSASSYGGLIPQGQQGGVTLTVNPLAAGLEAGLYTARMTFLTGVYSHEIDVSLEVLDFALEPDEGVTFVGPRSGPFLPAPATFTITNTDFEVLEWVAEIAESCAADPRVPVSWATVEPTVGVIKNPLGTGTLDVSTTASALLLPSGVYEAELCVESLDPTLPGGQVQSLQVRPLVLEVAQLAAGLDMVDIPAEPTAADLPAYRFRMSRYEVTAGEFERFLNDVDEDGGATEVGAFTVIDPVTGSLRLESGEPMFLTALDAPSSPITFDPAAEPRARYAVVSGRFRHPISHVSWYGAAKFCNWLTLAQDMGGARAYVEGSAAADWGAVADGGGLLDVRGFRLPRDGGVAGPSVTNEWFKVASAWVNAQNNRLFDRVYGFGRNTLTVGDANYLNSLDPFEGASTPVGFFNGVLYNFGGDGDVGNGVQFSTVANGNAYGVHDLTGNVTEWLHDRAVDGTAFVRGGHFLTPSSSSRLTTGDRASFAASTAVSTIGFRVVQVIPEDPPSVAWQDAPAIRVRGYLGGPLEIVSEEDPETALTWTVSNPADFTLDHVSFDISPGDTPIKFAQSPPQQLSGGSATSVALVLDESVVGTGVSPAPQGDFALVRGDVTPSGGPLHDYWIGRREVTNSAFAQFLNAVNDDLMAGTVDAATSYVSIDVQTGDAYVALQEEGMLRSGPPAPAVPLYVSSSGRIHRGFNSYAVEAGFGNHPVVGVTWFGAVKYANWLSRQQGVPGEFLAYGEGPATVPAEWRPVSADSATWPVGFSDAERTSLVDRAIAYRLPMDGGELMIGPFDEWYKAAAWSWSDGLFHTFGFGRDELLPGDANYFDSMDGELESTTPVGFYNGVNRLRVEPSACDVPIGDLTAVTGNQYGLLDATGNVWEWTQEGSGDPEVRLQRGGGWREPATDLGLTTGGQRFQPAAGGADDAGFRLVRGTGSIVTVSVEDHLNDRVATRRMILDLREPFDVTPRGDVQFAASYGEDPAAFEQLFMLHNFSQSQMPWELQSSAPWLVTDADVEGAFVTAGTLDGATSMSWRVAVDDAATPLVPGAYSGVATLSNGATGAAFERRVTLVVGDAIVLSPVEGQAGLHEFEGLAGGPFITAYEDGSVGESRGLVLANTHTGTLHYDVTATVGWIELDTVAPLAELSGSLDSGEVLDMVMTMGAAAEALTPGEYTATVRAAVTDPDRPGAAWVVEAPVTLNVTDPVRVTASCDGCATCGTWAVGPGGVIEQGCDQLFVLENLEPADGALIELQVESDSDWLDLSASTLDLLPGGVVLLTASINDTALALHDGEYLAALTFRNTVDGTEQCRQIALTVTETLSVSPFDGYVARGAVGLNVRPALRPYTLTNVDDGGGPLDWVVCADADWVVVAGGGEACTAVPAGCQPAASRCGTLEDGESTTVLVGVDAVAAAPLGAGTHVTTLQVATGAVSIVRDIEVTLVQPLLALDAMAPVSASAQEPSGPTYDFELGAYPVTNAEFVTFLNDALARLSTEAGDFLFFESTTGDVYVADQQAGAIGADHGGLSVKAFSPAVGGRIAFDGTSYAVVDAATYGAHPVTGVSWYGAAKYCNWLTLDQGFPHAERCYVEGPAGDLATWRPDVITTSAWASRDLNDAERTTLVADRAGYRLPMDDGANNASPSSDSADAFNEWYKAAAWDVSAQLHRAYGSGTSAMDMTLANFLCSGDPFEDPVDCNLGGTTPVGFYDGVNVLADGTPTVDAVNGFGLYDMAGNIFEWIQGRYNGVPGAVGFRTIRGGSYATSTAQLQTSFRAWAPAGSASAQIGFRVVRSLPRAVGDADGDGDVDLDDAAALAACLGGPAGAPLSPLCAGLDLQGADMDVDLQDAAALQNGFGLVFPAD